MREALAKTVHRLWAHWMTYLFSVGRYNSDGSVTIPADYVSRWKRQMVADYESLPETEKMSDRKHADEIFRTFLNTSPSFQSIVDFPQEQHV